MKSVENFFLSSTNLWALLPLLILILSPFIAIIIYKKSSKETFSVYIKLLVIFSVIYLILYILMLFFKLITTTFFFTSIGGLFTIILSAFLSVILKAWMDQKNYSNEKYIELIENIEINEYQRITKIYDSNPDISEQNRASILVKYISLVNEAKDFREKHYKYIKIDDDLPDPKDYFYPVEQLKKIESNSKAIDIIRELFPNIYKENDFNNPIMGDWIMSYKNAKKIKYLIGINISDKKVIGAYKIKNSDGVDLVENGRIRFDPKCVDEMDPNNFKDTVIPYTEEWTSRNPVLYYKRYLKAYDYKLDKYKYKTLSKLGIDSK